MLVMTVIYVAGFCLKGIAKKFLFPFLPQFVTVFTATLQQPDGSTSDSGLKMEVLKVR